MDKQYKIIDIGDEESDEQERYKLFDLLEDPKEQDNIAADNPEIHANMVAMVKEWEQSVYESFQGKDYNSTHSTSAGPMKGIPQISVHSRGHQLVLRFDGRHEAPGEAWLMNLHGRRVLKARVYRRGDGVPEAAMNTKGLSVGTYLVLATGYKRRSVTVR